MRPHQPKVMSAQDTDFAQRLSHHPYHIYEAVISPSDLPKWKFSTIKTDRSSSLGKFDDLPLELLHECIIHMDLLSLLRLSRVSSRGTAVVIALRPLQTWLTAVDTLPTLLAKAHILALHSLSTLNAALHSKQCASCSAYSTFLHLLSAQRCYFTCLRVNQSLWVISLPKGQKMPRPLRPPSELIAHNAEHLRRLQRAQPKQAQALKAANERICSQSPRPTPPQLARGVGARASRRRGLRNGPDEMVPTGADGVARGSITAGTDPRTSASGWRSCTSPLSRAVGSTGAARAWSVIPRMTSLCVTRWSWHALCRRVAILICTWRR